MITDTLPLATAGAGFAALYVSHQISDHWIQTDYQAAHKGRRDWQGRRACAGHVATHTITNALMMLPLLWLGASLTVLQVTAALAVIAVTHYWADRRYTLERLAGVLAHAGFYRLGRDETGRAGCLGTGAYALDQSWHVLWLGVAAVILAI